MSLGFFCWVDANTLPRTTARLATRTHLRQVPELWQGYAARGTESPAAWRVEFRMIRDNVLMMVAIVTMLVSWAWVFVELARAVR